MVEIADFEKIADVQPEVIDRFEGRIPDDIIELWRNYGYGTFGNGYFRVIDPVQYLDALGVEGLGKKTGDGVTVPVIATAMTDLITWEPNIGMANLRFRDEVVSGAGFEIKNVVAKLKRPRANSVVEAMNWAMYPEAVERYGVPEYGKSFTYVPLRSLGGPGTVETLKINETVTAMQLMIEMQGPIEH
ncbi:MAG TPA: DUF1851 domain-containing protein [Candidatus Agrococcus pullicola]|uniref:DUF1851 domain-containing protein n=1 Tax=Candidatus Agrococcus pullicola TaxID=2838429 RepID=A0A9D1YXM0_9MICO|nr:DUF1851 domain-containing protein [Candidatus Agrococcus pullicola]